MQNDCPTYSSELRKLASSIVVSGGILFEAGRIAVRNTGILFKACDEIDRLREALSLYANEKSWKASDGSTRMVFEQVDVINGWEPAAKALSGSE